METTRTGTRSRLVAVSVLAALVALVIGAILGPHHQVVDEQTAGDRALAARAHAAVDGVGGYRSLLVAEVTSDSVSWAGIGNSESGRDGRPPDLESVYEAGSVTKTFTGSLFAEAIARGEVGADDALSQHLPELAGTDAGKVTLASLAQHRSGLPPLGATVSDRSLIDGVLNENPYLATSTEQLIADARTATVDPDQPPTYSNFGWSLLGTALARAAGAPDYVTLVNERIIGPLGMSHTEFAATRADIPSEAVPGFLPNGTPAPHWLGEGYQPSGTSTLTSVGDLSLWAQAQLNGTSPGKAALEPTADYPPGAQIGWGWITSELRDEAGTAHTVVWHNGRTGGFSSIVAIDRDADRAIVVLGNTSTPVDAIAAALLYDTEVSGQPTSVKIAAWFIYGLAALFSLLALRRAWRGTAVLPMIESLLTATFGLVLAWHSGPWMFVGGWAYGLVLAPALAAAAVSAIRARALPFRPERHAWATWIGITISVLLIVGATQLW